MRRNRKVPSAPDRRPHPDARVEAELQRIVTLRRAVSRQERLIEQNLQQIDALRDKARNNAAYIAGENAERMAKALVKENSGLETEISNLHDRIDERIAKLTDTDLAYL
jgi:predicted  nucleic acid-binding Zn-ribbon protein